MNLILDFFDGRCFSERSSLRIKSGHIPAFRHFSKRHAVQDFLVSIVIGQFPLEGHT
jgi:hypothetical protein